MYKSSIEYISDDFSQNWKEPFETSVNVSDVTLAENETDAHEKKRSRPSSMSFQFDPKLITSLNISNLCEATAHIFRSGRLPEWLLCFQNLRVLDVSRTGVVYVEPGILHLKSLKEFYLQQNHISTWPYFLVEAVNLEKIRLDGNPCLERAFRKSPTLRSVYFSWSITKASVHTVPKYIRGPEWPPARSTRLSNTSSLKDLGFYCGGIYTLSTPLDTSERGYLTQTTPDVVEFQQLNVGVMACTTHPGSCESNESTKPHSWTIFTRPSTRAYFESSMGITANKKTESPYKTLFTEFSSNSKKHHSTHGSVMDKATEDLDDKRSQIQFEIFEDIRFLLERSEIKKKRAPTDSIVQGVFIVGSSSDSFNQYIPGCDELSICGIRDCCQVLLDEENVLIDSMRLVIEKFCQKKLKPFQSQNAFSSVFFGFPAILKVHKDYILPALNVLVKDMNSILQKSNKRELQVHPPSANTIATTELVISKASQCLANAFRHMHNALNKYLNNLCNAEYLLGMTGAIKSLYRDEDTFEIIQTRIARSRNGFIGQLTISKAKHPIKRQSLLKNTGIYEKDHVSPSVSKLASWFEKSSNSTTCCTDIASVAKYLYLPLVRVVRFERVLTSLTKFSRGFTEAASVARSMRTMSADTIERSRERERRVLLATKFRTSLQWMENYQWDALLWIRSRGYFAQGILEHNTNDVIDVDSRPVSFVKELFTGKKRRALRLICCGDEIQLWDEVMEEYIGTIASSEIVAVDPIDTATLKSDVHFSRLQNTTEVRVVFCEVRETCLVELENFTAKYAGSSDQRYDFISACNGWPKKSV